MSNRALIAVLALLPTFLALGLPCCTSSKRGGADGDVGNGGVGGGSGAGGAQGLGGLIGDGGLAGSGATQATGGLTGSGGTAATGGVSEIDAGVSNGGAPRTGGAVGKGGITGQGGMPATGGVTASAGTTGPGGQTQTGGRTGTGGIDATGGATAIDGSVAADGPTGTGGTTSACPVGPARGSGTLHCEANATGAYGSYHWMFWQAESGGCLTTYGDADAGFSVAWNNSGDLVARVGLQWDAPTTYDQLGTITAEFAETKTGTAGAYSYIGIYGSSVSSCVEFYIIDDAFSTMPITPPAASTKGTAVIDGETYTFYLSEMTGTGGSCSRSHPWMEVYSVRKTARQCGQISITDHFAAWRQVGIAIGAIDQITLAVEALNGVGTVDFATASITVE